MLEIVYIIGFGIACYLSWRFVVWQLKTQKVREEEREVTTFSSGIVFFICWLLVAILLLPEA